MIRVLANRGERRVYECVCEALGAKELEEYILIISR